MAKMLSREDALRIVHSLVQDYSIIGPEVYSGTKRTGEDSAPLFPNDAYPIKGKKGCALIMSNAFEKIEEYKRVQASKNDIDLMKELWKTKIGCELFQIPDTVGKGEMSDAMEKQKKRYELQMQIRKNYPDNVYSDVSADEMKELLKCLSETKKKYAYIVVVISTHGALWTESKIEQAENEGKQEEEGENTQEAIAQVFFGNDGKPVREEEMIQHFYNDEKSSLGGIPKFFILNYCRSKPGENHPTPNSLGGPSGAQSGVQSERLLPENSIPPAARVSDTVLVFATHKYFVGFQYVTGSWLITAIANAFGESFKTKGVLDMLTKVNKEVNDECEKVKKNQKAKVYWPSLATSVFKSSLLKEFRLWIKPQDGTTSAPSSDVA